MVSVLRTVSSVPNDACARDLFRLIGVNGVDDESAYQILPYQQPDGLDRSLASQVRPAGDRPVPFSALPATMGEMATTERRRVAGGRLRIAGDRQNRVDGHHRIGRGNDDDIGGGEGFKYAPGAGCRRSRPRAKRTAVTGDAVAEVLNKILLESDFTVIGSADHRPDRVIGDRNASGGRGPRLDAID